MEDEIDLREYLDVLIRRWKWIVALTLIAALAAGAISFLLLKPSYEATALVLIANPRYRLRFDPRLETLSEVETNSKVYPSLAISDDLLKQVLDALDPPLPTQEHSLRGLRGRLSASAGSDSSLLQLKVANGDPERAAQIANTWAEQYVGYVNELYGRRSEDVVFFTQQLDAARSALDAAEQALVDYEAHNQQSILQSRLNAKRSALDDYLKAQNELTVVIEDAGALRGQLEGQAAAEPASLADDLTALLLEVQALGQNAELPIQLQVAGGSSLSNKTVGEQTSLLSDLIDALENRLGEIDMQVETLSTEIPPLQEALQQATAEKDRLTLDRDVARSTFTTLANKVEEARIAAQDETGEVRLASQASVPSSPAGPRKLMNTAIAGFLGLFLGVFVAFFVEYWRSPRTAAK